MLDTMLSRHWWAIALRGVVSVAFGAMALVWPGALMFLFGAYALVDGILALGTAAFDGRLAGGWRGWLLLEGIFGIAAGTATLLWPEITTMALLRMIAAWAIVTGVLEVAATVILRREVAAEWLLAVGGVAAVAMGVFLAVLPQQGVLPARWLIGLYAIIFGMALVALAVRLRQRRSSQAGAQVTAGGTR
jgi:uncharacterized membrane protein HdeD (DUF308 family)